ncbi:MAG: DUF1097 domain-containing protein [Phycisphaerae bacterium]|nr:DUF1097 domain-containing protein [Phycisphaerae bacterium]
MPFSKFIVFPIFVASQAAVLMLLARFIPIGPETIGGPALITWISFQSWAMYFLGGCTVKMAGKTTIGYACGIIASIAIFKLIGVFAPQMGGYWATALAVFIVVIPVMCAEKVEILNFIPAWFMGAAVFFALQFMSKAGTMAEYAAIAIPEMIACVVGLGFGVCTVSFRTWYEKKVMPQTQEAADQVKKSA